MMTKALQAAAVLLFSFSALTVAATTKASAAVTTELDWSQRGRQQSDDVGGRIVVFNLVCRYDRSPASSAGQSTATAPEAHPKCYAGARFEKLVDYYGREVQDDSQYPRNPKLEVECDGYTIHNDGARRFTDREGTRIQAETAAYPAIVLPVGALQDGRRNVSSVLELRDASLEGSCLIYPGNP